MGVSCCVGLSISSTRMLVMDERSIQPDECDYRLIAFSNFLQIFTCICQIAAIFSEDARHFVHILRMISDFVFLSVASCMAAQVHYELEKSPMRHAKMPSGTFEGQG